MSTKEQEPEEPIAIKSVERESAPLRSEASGITKSMVNDSEPLSSRTRSIDLMYAMQGQLQPFRSNPVVAQRLLTVAVQLQSLKDPNKKISEPAAEQLATRLERETSEIDRLIAAGVFAERTITPSERDDSKVNVSLMGAVSAEVIQQMMQQYQQNQTPDVKLSVATLPRQSNQDPNDQFYKVELLGNPDGVSEMLAGDKSAIRDLEIAGDSTSLIGTAAGNAIQDDLDELATKQGDEKAAEAMKQLQESESFSPSHP